MSEYTPTTAEVRDYATAEVWGGFTTDEFNAWLASTVRAAKAEAWDEGNDAGEICAMDAESPDHVCQRNPYRNGADQ